MQFERLARKLFSMVAGPSLLLVLLVAPGCHRGATKPADGAKAFASASPDVKAEWDKIVSADTTNDYATIILNSRKLLPQNSLTPEQRSALSAVMTSANTRMMDGVQKGDPAAIKANQDVNQHWR